ncbi:MAG: LLM class flavin-dependent oxidoreductase [Dehalococcoidia bacterium]
MQFGILDLVDWHPGTMTQEERYQQVIDLAVVAEDLGFDTYWVGEHHFSHYVSPHPAILLAAIAARTRRIRIGTSVVLAAHHDPLRLAEDYAMVDVISGGRLDLVVGRGLFLQGYRGYQVAFESVRGRLEEAIAVMRRAWQESPFSFTGAVRVFDQIEVQPRPLQQPHPPLWVAGGRSLDTVDYAAREGLNLALPQLMGPPSTFQPTVDRYRERLAESGRDPAAYRLSVGQHAWVAPSHAEALDDWRESYPRYTKMVADEMQEDLYAGTELEEVAKRTRQAATVPADRLLKGVSALGTPEHVAARICEAWDTLRMDHHWACFNLGGIPTAKLTSAMQLYARNVIPAVARRVDGLGS